MPEGKLVDRIPGSSPLTWLTAIDNCWLALVPALSVTSTANVVVPVVVGVPQMVPLLHTDRPGGSAPPTTDQEV